MSENNNSGAWVLGLGMAAFLGWELWKQKQAAGPAGSAATPAPATLNVNAGATALSNVAYPSSGTTAPSLNPANLGLTVLTNPDVAGSLPAGITTTVYNGVQQWAQVQAPNWPPAATLAAAGIPSEYATIYDLQTNVWAYGKTMTPAQAQAWTALYNKYS
jgi:hypothetical protein